MSCPTSTRKRIFTSDKEGEEYQNTQPKKRSKPSANGSVASYSSFHTENMNRNEYDGPKCPKPYARSSQANGLLSSSSDDGNESILNDTHPSRNVRRTVPDLHSSQESLLPITPSNKHNHSLKHKQTRGDIRIVLERVNDIKSTFNLVDLRRSFSDKGWLFILIGFAVGYLMCYATISIMNPHPHSKPFGKYKYIESNGECPCNITTNTTCVQCKECMDKYWAMNKEYTECIKKTKLKEYQEEEIKHSVCKQYLSRISKLEHDLGDCNVELGHCQQLGRQKDSLDEKRVEEIRKQKIKFSLCNEQLKRYKDKAKKDRKQT